jgi:hypothetical protein
LSLEKNGEKRRTRERHTSPHAIHRTLQRTIVAYVARSVRRPQILFSRAMARSWRRADAFYPSAGFREVFGNTVRPSEGQSANGGLTADCCVADALRRALYLQVVDTILIDVTFM